LKHRDVRAGSGNDGLELLPSPRSAVRGGERELLPPSGSKRPQRLGASPQRRTMVEELTSQMAKMEGKNHDILGLVQTMLTALQLDADRVPAKDLHEIAQNMMNLSQSIQDDYKAGIARINSPLSPQAWQIPREASPTSSPVSISGLARISQTREMDFSKRNIKYMVSLNHNNSNIQIDNSEIEITLLAYSLELSRIVNNYIGNALKYTLEGGQVSVELEVNDRDDGKSDLAFRVLNSGDELEGEGAYEAIWKEGVQLDVGPQTKGHGQGLANVRQLARMIAGRAGAHYNRERGSHVFWFEGSFNRVKDEATASKLPRPVKSPPVAAPDVIGEAMRQEIAALKVLLVEDSKLTGKVVRERILIRGLGLSAENVVWVETQAEALEEFSREGALFNVVLMDMQFPVEKDGNSSSGVGLQCTRRIREIEKERAGATSQIILRNANKLTDDVWEECQGVGMDGHCVGIMSADKVSRALADAITRSEVRHVSSNRAAPKRPTFYM
jgi:CheY-like chemotaxis protein